jgi:hypothetical protein
MLGGELNYLVGFYHIDIALLLLIGASFASDLAS